MKSMKRHRRPVAVAAAIVSTIGLTAAAAIVAACASNERPGAIEEGPVGPGKIGVGDASGKSDAASDAPADIDAGDGNTTDAPLDGTNDALTADAGDANVVVDATPPIDATAFAGRCQLDPAKVYVKGHLASGYWPITGIAPVTDLTAWCSYYASAGVEHQIRPSDKTLVFTPGSDGIVRFSPPPVPILYTDAGWSFERGPNPARVSDLCYGSGNSPDDFLVDTTGNLIAKCNADPNKKWLREDGGTDYDSPIVIHAMGANYTKLVETATALDKPMQPTVIDQNGVKKRAAADTTFPGPLKLARWGTTEFLVVYAVDASPGNFELWKVTLDGTPTKVGAYAARTGSLTQNQIFNLQTKLDRDGALYELYPTYVATDSGNTVDEMIVQKRPLSPGSTEVLVNKAAYQNTPATPPASRRVYPETLVTGP